FYNVKVNIWKPTYDLPDVSDYSVAVRPFYREIDVPEYFTNSSGQVCEPYQCRELRYYDAPFFDMKNEWDRFRIRMLQKKQFANAFDVLYLIILLILVHVLQGRVPGIVVGLIKGSLFTFAEYAQAAQQFRQQVGKLGGAADKISPRLRPDVIASEFMRERIKQIDHRLHRPGLTKEIKGRMADLDTAAKNIRDNSTTVEALSPEEVNFKEQVKQRAIDIIDDRKDELDSNLKGENARKNKWRTPLNPLQPKYLTAEPKLAQEASSYKSESNAYKDKIDEASKSGATKSEIAKLKIDSEARKLVSDQLDQISKSRGGK
ncbi:MAG: hypothetical protein AAF153_02350, partial [Pseudomonadota bacterium]